jgi:predicted glycoside hydrolase/deacetylase ChbG (UPF0249 family)
LIETCASISNGTGAAERYAVLNIDDLGASHGANQAFLDLAQRHLVSGGSAMAPTPWFREIAEAAAANATLEVGVHLTLTSEWQYYRWSPLSTVSRASGLIDDDGYMWRDVASLRRHIVPEAAEVEMRAQIERCLSAGIKPTHVDAHMGAAMMADLLPIELRLAREYGLFPVLPRTITWAPDPKAYQRMLDELEQASLPVVDHCRATLPKVRDELPQAWQQIIWALPDGLTHFALHATQPGDFEAISSQHAGWRLAEYELLASGAFAQWLEAAGIRVISYRNLAFSPGAKPQPSTTRSARHERH